MRAARDPVKYRLIQIRSKCKKKGIPFDIKDSDITIPSHCPLLGTPLTKYSDQGRNYSRDNMWSVDRKDPTKGYIKGNVWVISHRANSMKHDATLEELELLVKNLKEELE